MHILNEIRDIITTPERFGRVLGVALILIILIGYIACAFAFGTLWTLAGAG